MGDTHAIEKAIKALPPSDLAEFRRWFSEFDSAAWGKLDHLADEALADYRSGSAREL